MARKKKVIRRRRPPSSTQVEPTASSTLDSLLDAESWAETTGKMVVTFLDDSPRSMKNSMAALRNTAGLSNICHLADFAAESFDYSEANDADAMIVDELGIAIISGDPDQQAQMSFLSSDQDNGVIVEPEYLNFAFETEFDDDLLDVPDVDEETPESPRRGSPDYLRGYRDGVSQLTGTLLATEPDELGDTDRSMETSRFSNSRMSTWGLRASRVTHSRYSGEGIRVAVLDTGLDLNHPDFDGRTIRSQSFIPGEAVQDRNGHGTHCIGTACGPRRPGVGPRYGVAYNADIFAGKVLSNAGSGSDGAILAGINWALRNKCEIVSMSLGRGVRPGEAPSRSYEIAGRRALRAGSLIIAAAGNDSSRPFVVRPVSSPANARSILAIAAVDPNLRVASFSNGGVNSGGGEVNLSGPGVDVHSSWPMPRRLRSIQGTSMATPHVAGIAALIAEEVPSARGVRLYRELRRRVRRLRGGRTDIGSGLAEAL